MIDPEISIVVPVFNEAENLSELFKRIQTVLEKLGLSFELIFINDGSTDNSLAVLKELSGCGEARHTTKIIDLSRNFGQQAAITAGIDYACGQMIVIMDADLQDPPEMIPKLVTKYLEGFDCVYGIRQRRIGESFIKRVLTRLFYRLLRRMTKIDVPLDAGDFRLISRKVARELVKMREKHRFVRGLVSWVGFKQIGIPYQRGRRLSGKTKYPFRKLFGLAMDGFTSLSFVPLRMISYAGLAIVLSGITLIGLIMFQYLRGTEIKAWYYLVAAILTVGGAQLFGIGVLGEYVGRIFEASQGRSLYIVNELFVADSPANRGVRDFELADCTAKRSKITES